MSKSSISNPKKANPFAPIIWVLLVIYGATLWVVVAGPASRCVLAATYEESFSDSDEVLSAFSKQLQESEGLHMAGRVYNERLAVPGRVSAEQDLELLSQIAFEAVMTPSKLLLYVWQFEGQDIDLRVLESERVPGWIERLSRRPDFAMLFERETGQLSMLYRTSSGKWTRAVEPADTQFGTSDIPVDSIFSDNCWFGSLLETWVGPNAPFTQEAMPRMSEVAKLHNLLSVNVLRISVDDSEPADREWDFGMTFVNSGSELVLTRRTGVRDSIQRSRCYDRFQILSKNEVESLMEQRQSHRPFGILIDITQVEVKEDTPKN